MLNPCMAGLGVSLAVEMIDFAGSDAGEGFIALRETRVPRFGSE